MCVQMYRTVKTKKKERKEEEKSMLFQSQSESVKQKWKKITLYQQEYALAYDNNTMPQPASCIYSSFET